MMSKLVVPFRKFERTGLGCTAITSMPCGPASAASDEANLEAVEKRHILAMLERCEGNQSEAARQLGISRKTIERKLQSWGMG